MDGWLAGWLAAISTICLLLLPLQLIQPLVLLQLKWMDEFCFVGTQLSYLSCIPVLQSGASIVLSEANNSWLRQTGTLGRLACAVVCCCCCCCCLCRSWPTSNTSALPQHWWLVHRRHKDKQPVEKRSKRRIKGAGEVKSAAHRQSLMCCLVDSFRMLKRVRGREDEASC